MRVRVTKAYDRFNDCLYLPNQFRSRWRFFRTLFLAWRGGNGLNITVKVDL